MSVLIYVSEQISQSISASKIIAEQSDIQLILQIASANGGNVSLVDCMIATGKHFTEVMNTIESLCDEGLLEIGNHQDSAIIYRLIQKPVI